jgi:hypothetical protein
MHLRSLSPTERNKGDGAAVAVYHPITTLDPRLTAYFATLTFEGGQALRLLVDTGRYEKRLKGRPRGRDDGREGRKRGNRQAPFTITASSRPQTFPPSLPSPPPSFLPPPRPAPPSSCPLPLRPP